MKTAQNLNFTLAPSSSPPVWAAYDGDLEVTVPGDGEAPNSGALDCYNKLIPSMGEVTKQAMELLVDLAKLDISWSLEGIGICRVGLLDSNEFLIELKFCNEDDIYGYWSVFYNCMHGSFIHKRGSFIHKRICREQR